MDGGNTVSVDEVFVGMLVFEKENQTELKGVNIDPFSGNINNNSLCERMSIP